MVQVVLGETWDNSDVDIWCTLGAAQEVRDQIKVSDFTQVIDKYGPVSDKTTAPELFATKIGSVEHWEMLKDFDSSHAVRESDGWKCSKPLACESQLLPYTGLKGGLDVVIG